MTDEEFLRALERCELPERDFGHAAHVRAAYLYLQEGDFVGALERARRVFLLPRSTPTRKDACA